MKQARSQIFQKWGAKYIVHGHIGHSEREGAGGPPVQSVVAKLSL